MNSTEFCYWLQGFFELQSPVTLSPEQVFIIKEHLNLVFNKVTKDPLNQFKLSLHNNNERAQLLNNNLLVYKHEASC